MISVAREYGARTRDVKLRHAMANATDGGGRADSAPAATVDTSVRVAWALWILSEALVLLGLGMRGLHLIAQGTSGFSLSRAAVSFVFVAVQLSLATLGALIIARRQGNRIGWFFCAAGFVTGLVTFTESYTVFALAAGPGSLPGMEISAWLTNLIQGPSLFGFFVFLLLLFPDGKLLSPRWRPVAWCAFFGIASITLLETLAPGPL
jgi:hypothetical protein